LRFARVACAIVAFVFPVVGCSSGSSSTPGSAGATDGAAGSGSSGSSGSSGGCGSSDCSASNGSSGSSTGSGSGTSSGSSSGSSGSSTSSGSTSGSASSGSGASSGSASSGASSGAADAGSCTGNGCNSVVNGAQTVQEIYASGPVPTLLGGTIQDGTYFLTSDQLYGVDAGSGNTGRTLRETLVVSGTTGQVVLDNGVACERGTVTLSTAMHILTATTACGNLFGGDGGMPSVMGPYGVTISTFTIAVPSTGGGGTQLVTFTKQP
jgi:hypothetical protein